MPEDFQGHANRRCGEHRTVGEHRAWCFSCCEWCYPNIRDACAGCQPDPAVLYELVSEALGMLQYGQRPPGAPNDPQRETWFGWSRRAEALLRGETPPP